jgi:predicted DNA binding CopG/RHH family protein
MSDLSLHPFLSEALISGAKEHLEDPVSLLSYFEKHNLSRAECSIALHQVGNIDLNQAYKLVHESQLDFNPPGYQSMNVHLPVVLIDALKEKATQQGVDWQQLAGDYAHQGLNAFEKLCINRNSQKSLLDLYLSLQPFLSEKQTFRLPILQNTHVRLRVGAKENQQDVSSFFLGCIAFGFTRENHHELYARTSGSRPRQGL